MVDQASENHSDYYDEISAGYAELHREEQEKKISLMRQVLRIKRDSLVLDVGCGPGFTDWGAMCIGIDPSRGLLKQASFPVVQGVAEYLPFFDSSFDFVLSVTALQNFSDPRKGLGEIARVSKGPVAISFLKKAAKAAEYEQLFSELFVLREMLIEVKDIILIGSKR
jgi:ubiquinone/menaquinone biosynthesis C-methylase UbiE